MMKKILLALILSLSLVGLSACSKFHMANSADDDFFADDANPNFVADEDVQTSGLGSDDELITADNEALEYKNKNRNAIMPGHNQTYYFDFDSNHIHQIDYRAIQAQANYLIEHPNTHIVLEGHTDDRGSREYNVALGERRAKSIREALLMDSVEKNQVRLLSYGQEKPAVAGHNEAAYTKNRRVNLVFEHTA